MKKSNQSLTNLILSGGGSRIAYQTGVVKNLLENGYVFNSFVGTSSGALVGIMLAQNKYVELEKIVLSLNNWFLIFRRLLVWYFLTKYVSLKDVKHDFYFTVLSLYDGKVYLLKTEDFNSNKEFRKALFASCDFPTFWTKPTKCLKLKDGSKLYNITDAGAKQSVPIVNNFNSIIVSTISKDTAVENKKSSIENFIRYISFAFNAIHKENLENYTNSCIIRPNVELYSTITFTNQKIKQMFTYGYAGKYC